MHRKGMTQVSLTLFIHICVYVSRLFHATVFLKKYFYIGFDKVVFYWEHGVYYENFATIREV